MHQGTSTRLGRLMAGSHAGMAHEATGQGLFGASAPPAIQVSQGMVDSCHKGVAASGSALCGIDRAVHAGAMARAFDAQGVGVLGLRDANEPQGLESCEATHVGPLEDGMRVSRGPWNVSRAEDPRPCVMVEPKEGTPVVSWATPKVEAAVEAIEWPRVSRARSARQATSCKGMMDHGARNTHEGRKTLVGPDRHPPRARAHRAQALEVAPRRVDKQAEARKATQDHVVESASKGPGKRLAQRQRASAGLATAWHDAQHTHDHLAEHAKALGPPRQRADRAVRTQTILTVRPRL